MDRSNDSCDDSLLIDAYEQSVGEVNRLIEDRLNLVDADSSEDDGAPSPALICRSRVVGSKKNLEQLNQPEPPSDGKNNDKLTVDWKPNDHCRAVWSEDGIEYEAVVCSINESNRSCLVRYIGYDNVEVHKLSSLRPSLGQKSRRKQAKDARSSESASNQLTSDSKVTEALSDPIAQSTNAEIDDHKIFESCPFVPPPPTQLLAALKVEEVDEMLSAMMMSWYMCGFHTGRYIEAQRNKK